MIADRRKISVTKREKKDYDETLFKLQGSDPGYRKN